MGRPTDFTAEIADAICSRLVDGESLRSICRDDDMPGQTTVFRWLASNAPEFLAFREQYTLAREGQADALFDEMLDIADDGTNDYVEKKRDDGSTYEAFDSEHVQRSRLRIDTRKWMAGKLKPKKYGDKTILGGDADNPIVTKDVSDTDLARLIVFQLTKASQV